MLRTFIPLTVVIIATAAIVAVWSSKPAPADVPRQATTAAPKAESQPEATSDLRENEAVRILRETRESLRQELNAEMSAISANGAVSDGIEPQIGQLIDESLVAEEAEMKLIGEISDRIAEARKVLGRTLLDIESQKRVQEQLERDLAKLKDIEDKSINDLNSVLSAISAKQSQCQRLDSEIDALRAKVAVEQNSISKQHVEVRRLRSSLRALQDDIAELESQRDDLDKKLERARKAKNFVNPVRRWFGGNGLMKSQNQFQTA